MGTLAAFFLAISGSIAARVMVSLGFGFFSYAAITTLVGSVSDAVTANYQGLPSVALNLLNLAGVGQCLGILLAALTTRASLVAIKKLRPI